MDPIIQRAAELFEVEAAAINGRSKTRCLVLARQAVAWAMRRLYKRLSLLEIGQKLGGRDHTTILYSIAAAEQRAENDPEYRALLQSLIASVDLTRPARTVPIVVLPAGSLAWLRLAYGGRARLTLAA